MQMRQVALLFGLSFGAIGLACSSPSSPPVTILPPGNGAGTSAGGASSNGGGAQAGGATVTAGSSTGGASTTGGSSTGGASTAGGSSNAGATGSTAGATSGGGSGSTLSEGCGKDLPAIVTPGAWSEMANQKNVAGKPPAIQVPCVADPNGKADPACPGPTGMVSRGYWVYVNPGYDKTKPAKVIYEGAGCGDTSNAYGGTAAYPYQNVNGKNPQVIQVGMDYSRNDHCYDNQNPTSNDFSFFPLMMADVENKFCVDKTKQYWSGYSTGSWVGNQFTCAFPDKLRGIVSATGNEPDAQPTCKSGFPVAGLFLHDENDTYNTGVKEVPGCSRLLKQNGCTTQTCDYKNAAVTTAYPVPGTVTGQPASLKCVSFNGCPANAQVVWCSTTLGGGDTSHYIGAGAWVYQLFWDFINKN